MSDAEAWAVIGETIRGSGQLYYGGLCNTLVQAAREGVLEPYQWLRMENQLYTNRKKYSKGKKHFWPLKQIAPRVRACHALAEIVSKKNGAA
jgi:hypothetical protein